MMKYHAISKYDQLQFSVSSEVWGTIPGPEVCHCRPRSALFLPKNIIDNKKSIFIRRGRVVYTLLYVNVHKEENQLELLQWHGRLLMFC